MADEVVVQPVSTDAPVQPVATATVSPSIESPVSLLGSDPEVKTESAPSSDPPTTEVAPVVELVKADEKPQETKVETQKSVEGADTAQPDDEKKAENTQSEEPAPLPTYDAFTLPEGATLEAEKLGTFNKMLGEFESLTKADHAEAQKFGQQLIDRHIAEVQDSIQRYHQTLVDSWEREKSDWVGQFKSDPELGGNRMETTINTGRNIISTYGGTPEQQKEFRDALVRTGMEGHPGMIRLLANIAKSPMVQEGRPLPAKAPAMKQSKPNKFYGGNTR